MSALFYIWRIEYELQFESGKNREINETPPEVKVDSEQLSETEETAENFDDCSLNEVQDSKGNEVNAESLEEAEESYDDCGSQDG